MGLIINGKYHPDKSSKDVSTPRSVKDIYQAGRIVRQARTHAHHLIQPNNADGTPNKDFIDYYPESSKDHGFIKEEEGQNYDVTK